jgi:hypothetical protein
VVFHSLKLYQILPKNSNQSELTNTLIASQPLQIGLTWVSLKNQYIVAADVTFYKQPASIEKSEFQMVRVLKYNNITAKR